MREEIDFYKKNRYMKAPFLLQIEITNKCPLKCTQCYKAPNGGIHMDFRLLKKIIRDAYESGIKVIMFNGGEPLLYPYIIEALKLCKFYKLDVNMATSGINLDKKLLQEIRQTKCSLDLAISLNGSTSDIHEISRDDYNSALKAIKIMSDEGFGFSINWVSRTDNVYDFERLINLAEEYNADHVSVITNKIDGNGKMTDQLSKKHYIYLANFINEYNLKNKVQIKVQYCFPFLNNYISKHINKHKRLTCGAGINLCCINVEGYYKPCIHLEFYENMDSINRFWNESIYLKKIRNKIFSNKNDCEGCDKVGRCRSCFCMSVNNSLNLTYGMEQCPIKEIEVLE